MNPMHRRTFLALGSAPLLSALLPTLSMAQGQDGSDPGIYYLRGSHTWTEGSTARKHLFEEARAQRDDLICASSLPNTRLNLPEVHLSFKALLSPGHKVKNLESVDLEHLSPVFRNVSFSAFSYRANALDTTSAPHAFLAPLDNRGGMDLRLTHSIKKQSQRETLRFGQGGIPLLPGVYLLSIGARPEVLPLAMIVDLIPPQGQA